MGGAGGATPPFRPRRPAKSRGRPTDPRGAGTSRIDNHRGFGPPCRRPSSDVLMSRPARARPMTGSVRSSLIAALVLTSGGVARGFDRPGTPAGGRMLCPGGCRRGDRAPRLGPRARPGQRRGADEARLRPASPMGLPRGPGGPQPGAPAPAGRPGDPGVAGAGILRDARPRPGAGGPRRGAPRRAQRCAGVGPPGVGPARPGEAGPSLLDAGRAIDLGTTEPIAFRTRGIGRGLRGTSTGRRPTSTAPWRWRRGRRATAAIGR